MPGRADEPVVELNGRNRFGRLKERFIRWVLRSKTTEASPVILVQRRVYVLPTPAGVGFAFSLGVMLLGAINYNLSLGYALTFLLAGLGVVDILHTFRNLAHLSISPGRAEPVFAGETARFTLLLDNTRTEERRQISLQLAGGAPTTSATLDIPPQSSATAKLPTPAARRGWLPLPRITIATTWPLGLIRAWAYAVPDMRCLVYPQPAARAVPLPISLRCAATSWPTRRVTSPGKPPLAWAAMPR